jgi:hypothetical protein
VERFKGGTMGVEFPATIGCNALRLKSKSISVPATEVSARCGMFNCHRNKRCKNSVRTNRKIFIQETHASFDQIN